HHGKRCWIGIDDFTNTGSHLSLRVFADLRHPRGIELPPQLIDNHFFAFADEPLVGLKASAIACRCLSDRLPVVILGSLINAIQIGSGRTLLRCRRCSTLWSRGQTAALLPRASQLTALLRWLLRRRYFSAGCLSLPDELPHQ